MFPSLVSETRDGQTRKAPSHQTHRSFGELASHYSRVQVALALRLADLRREGRVWTKCPRSLRLLGQLVNPHPEDVRTMISLVHQLVTPIEDYIGSLIVCYVFVRFVAWGNLPFGPNPANPIQIQSRNICRYTSHSSILWFHQTNAMVTPFFPLPADTSAEGQKVSWL